MRPIFRILADRADITALIADRLLSLTVTDEAGYVSDRVQIVLDDRDGAVVIPPAGAELAVSLGYIETGTVDMGLYRVDEVTLQGPDRQITIAAKAADSWERDAPGKIKGPKSRSWHDVTIGGLVARIAGEHGFVPAVAEAFAGIRIPHIDQTAESDIAFLRRLAEVNGALAKPAARHMLFVAPGEAHTATGQAMPRVVIAPGDVDTWRVTMAERAKYKAVIANWHDTASATLETVKVGEGEPVYTITHTYPDPDQAHRAATGRLDAYRRGASTLDLTMPGRADLGAETRLVMVGFGAGVDGEWVVTRAEHRMGDGGYACSVSAENPKPEGEGAKKDVNND